MICYTGPRVTSPAHCFSFQCFRRLRCAPPFQKLQSLFSCRKLWMLSRGHYWNQQSGSGSLHQQWLKKKKSLLTSKYFICEQRLLSVTMWRDSWNSHMQQVLSVLLWHTWVMVWTQSRPKIFLARFPHISHLSFASISSCRNNHHSGCYWCPF